MKEGIHPDYHTIKVIMTDGTSFETRSTYGKEGEELRLDIDPTTHPAWTGGGAYINKEAGQVAKFNKRFAALGLKESSSNNAPAKEAKPAAEQPKAEAKAAPAEAPAEESKEEAKPSE